MVRFLHRVRTMVWGEKPATREEQVLLYKIDAVILTFCCLQYNSNYLNRANFNNAYITGMAETLHYHGDQFNQTISVFTAGYIIGLWPNNLILQFVPPRIWLPLCGVVWGSLSACLAAAKTPQQVIVIRFFQAIFESSTFTGSHWILGSWYTESELGKRSGIFATAAQMGSLWSGVMQGRISQTMNGRNGLKSYQWLFIIDFCIAFPISLFGFVFFPDTPKRTRAWFLTESERQLAVSRLPFVGRTKMSKDLFRRVFGRWHVYLFSALFGFSSMLESAGINGVMGFWFKSLGFNQSKRNYYPLSLVSVAIFTTLIAAVWSDFHPRNRFLINPIMSIVILFSSILLLIWNIPYGLKFFALAIQGVSYIGQATNFAWANVICQHDDQERAIVLASMNVVSNVINSWWTIVLWPVTDAPRFQKGWISMFPLCVVTVLIASVIRYLEIRDRRLSSLTDSVETVTPSSSSTTTTTKPLDGDSPQDVEITRDNGIK